MEELARELGLSGIGDIVKLASNENALGPSPKAMKAMNGAVSDMHLYPDGSGHYLTEALARKCGVDPGQVVIGNGSNELIELLGHVFLGPDSSIVMSDGAFLIYRLIAMAFQAETRTAPMVRYTHDLDAMREAIREDTRMVFIANPNNPTGTMVDAAAIDGFMERVPDHPLVVFDEAYIELLPEDRQPDTLRYVREGRKVCVLRTFSKTYGLAGLRIGYGIMPSELAALLHRVRQPFNVNAMAQVAARAALEDDEHVADTQRMTRDGLRRLSRAFEERRLDYVPSVANFILVCVGKGRDMFARLQKRRVIVRPMDAYGFPDHVRVTVGTPDENDRFIEALDEALAERTEAS